MGKRILMAKSKKTKKAKGWWGCGETGTIIHYWRGCKMAHFGKQFGGFLNFFFNVYFWERETETETECELGRHRERGDTEPEAGSTLQAVSTEPDVGLEPMNREIMTWAKVGCLTDWATQVPRSVASLTCLFMCAYISIYVCVYVCVCVCVLSTYCNTGY